jgi:uncharacterized damage-inducible protein DinB
MDSARWTHGAAGRSPNVEGSYGERNRESLARLRELVERLDDDDLRRELPGGWTVADTLGHLAFYDRRAALLLDRFAREGVFPSPYDYDTINDIVPHFTRRMPPRATAEEALNAAEAANEAAAAIPAALLSEIQALNQVRPDRSEHRMNHLNDIETALEAR